MKIKKFLAVIIATVSAFIICTTTGCLTQAANMIKGNWTLNLDKSGEDAKKYVEDATLIFEERGVRVDIECVDGYSCELDSYYRFDDDYQYARMFFGDNTVAGSIGYCSFTLTDGYLWLSGIQLIKSSNEEVEEEFNEVVNIANLIFENDKSGQTNPSGPSKPSNPKGSKYEDIKTAYASAGYTVDVGFDGIDPSLSATLKQMQELYKQYGCAVTYIGKNINDVTNMELYMLLAAGTESNADEFASAFEQSYPGKVRRSGIDIIVSVSLFGTANFTPFEQATA